MALVSRDLTPFSGGGIAPVVAALARTLAVDCDVVLVTTDAHRDAWLALERPDLFGEETKLVFAAEPQHAPEAGFLSCAQAWSAALRDALHAHYGERGPDLVEFADYFAEGFVTLQDRRTGAPWLRDTQVVVRSHTTAEMVAVLDGQLGDDLGTNVVHEMERYCLRHADRLLSPGGDIRASYERFYGAAALAPATTLPDAFEAPAGEQLPGPSDGPLRLLVLGRLERRKGPQLLIRALRGSEVECHVRFVGDDTPTAPLGQSMRRWLEDAAADDDRITVQDAVSREAVGELMAAHDALVVPSLWECWPNTVREAYAQGRPVIATPVGGLTELVQDGATGWQASAAGPAALRELLERLAADPSHVRALHGAPALAEALARVNDPQRVRAAYARVLEPTPSPAPAAPPADPPLVSVVVPYFRLAHHLGETLSSVRAQNWPNLETVVVVDGSFAPEDRMLLELGEDIVVVAQANRGLGAARNLGVAVSRGAFVLTLDADDVIEPDYVAVAMAAFAATPELTHVTTWTRYVDELSQPLALPDNGYTPLGTWARTVRRDNTAGGSTAVFRRSVLTDESGWDPELASYEDWEHYRRLHMAGHPGDVIPHRLVRYRIRADSMMRTFGLRHLEVLEKELRAREREALLTGGRA